MIKSVYKAVPLASVNSNTFDGTYKVLTTGLPQACSFVRIVNNSDKDITVSFDGGITDHDFIPTDSAPLEIFCQEGAQPPAFISLMEKGTAVSVKGAAGAGLVYLSAYYNPVY